MLRILKKYFPYFLKRILQNSINKYKYPVNLHRGAHIHRTKFEANCSVGINSEVYESTVGRSSYIGNGSKISYAKIGRYCAVGDNVRIFIGNHPTRDIVSIHPCFYSINGNTNESYIKRQIFKEHIFVDSENKYVVSIGNDVWLGSNVYIMDGIKIGNGAVIGAGAVVTRDVEPYSIVVGIPAKHTRYRFNEEQIKFLEKFMWWEKDENWLKTNAEYFTDIILLVKKFHDIQK